MVRPRGEFYNVTPISLRIRPELKAWIEQRAKENGDTLNAQLNVMLEIARHSLIKSGGDNER